MRISIYLSLSLSMYIYIYILGDLGVRRAGVQPGDHHGGDARGLAIYIYIYMYYSNSGNNNTNTNTNTNTRPGSPSSLRSRTGRTPRPTSWQAMTVYC